MWLGRDDNKPTPFTGSSWALQVWGNIMTALTEDSALPPSSSLDIVWTKVNIAGVSGVNEGGTISTRLPFIKGTEPKSHPQRPTSGLKTIENEARNLMKSIHKIFQ